MYSESLRNKTIVTPNNRMADQVGISLSLQAMAESGLSVAVASDTIALSAYIKRLYKKLRYVKGYGTIPILVDNTHVFVGFIKAIRDENLSTVLDPTNLASQASTAFGNMRMWEVKEMTPENLDHQYFMSWSETVQKRLTAMQMVPEWDALDRIIEAILKGDLVIDQSIAFFGFDDYPPKVTRLIEAMTLMGVQISYPWYSKASDDVKESVLTSASPREHYKDVAKVAFNAYIQDPTKQVAIVHPCLHQKGVAQKIRRALTDAFEPQYILPQTSAYVQPFDFTYGEPISKEPMVSIALKVLGFLHERITQDHVIDLIVSPFFKGSEEERALRTRTCAIIRANGRHHYTIEQYINEQPRGNSFVTRLMDMVLEHRSHQKLAKPSVWIDHIVSLLETVGWSKGRSLNSNEYQIYMQLGRALSDIKRHDRLFGDVNFQGMLKIITLVLNATPYNPEIDPECPIKVMGALEAGGMAFDTVIMMQMDDMTWPAVASPSSFIPRNVQEAYDMPHNSPAYELSFAKKLAERIRSAATHVIYGYAVQDKGDKNRPSFVVQGEPVDPSLLAALPVDYMVSEYQRTPCHTVHDVLMPLDDNKASGGVGMLTDQASCAFKAVLKHRFNLRPLPLVTQGLSHIEQGNVLHEALELFWKEHKTQANLKAMSDEALTAAITQCVDDAFCFFPRRIDRAFIEIEITRLTKVLFEYMAVEKARPPFVVESVEASNKINIKGLALTYRSDRIDCVDVNNTGNFDARVAIDYKKGAISLRGMGEHLTQMQLPVQAIYDDKSIDGVAYGSLKPDEPLLLGIGDTPLFNGMKTVAKAPYQLNLSGEWSDVKKHWKRQIEKAANDFKRGVMKINPVNAQVCQTCDYQSLCPKFSR